MVVSGRSWGEFVAEAGKPGVVSRFGVQRVRVLERMKQVVQVRDTQGRPYKAFKPDGNAFAEVFQTADGRWRAETVRRFDANQEGYEPQWRRRWPDARFVMRLHIDDLVAIGTGAARRILRVVKLSDQRITCADTYEADSKRRHADETDVFQYFEKSAGSMRNEGLRRIGVDDLGHIKDPGPMPTGR